MRAVRGVAVAQQEERVPRTDFEIPYKELTTSDLIGQGAFGRVFKGRWRGTVTVMAVGTCGRRVVRAHVSV